MNKSNLGERAGAGERMMQRIMQSGLVTVNMREPEAQKSLSFTPGFSLVTQRNTKAENRFNGLPFSFPRKPFKRFLK